MPQPTESYDAVVIGGGLFGVYAALHLTRTQQRRVLLLEKERHLLTKASIVNQARLHGGYHYPRSVATARMSDDHKERFTRDHQGMVHTQFDKYYGIDRYGSFTDAQQFERFCAFLDLPCERITDHPTIRFDRLEALYRTVEHTFDPFLLADYYRQLILSEDQCTIWCDTQVEEADSQGQEWLIKCKGAKTSTVRTPLVVNATYAATNGVLQLFDLPVIDLMHEISEMVFVRIPGFEDTGLTVMDGPFASIMPYGKSGLLSLSSVAYTHHQVSYAPAPVFDCQAKRLDCTPEAPANCLGCPHRPVSHAAKMIKQVRQYLREEARVQYFQSMFTIKSKLRANFVDDGRPTEISKRHSQPDFYCIFAGKINSIYEIERLIVP